MLCYNCLHFLEMYNEHGVQRRESKFPLQMDIQYTWRYTCDTSFYYSLLGDTRSPGTIAISSSKRVILQKNIQYT